MMRPRILATIAALGLAGTSAALATPAEARTVISVGIGGPIYRPYYRPYYYRPYYRPYYYAPPVVIGGGYWGPRPYYWRRPYWRRWHRW